MDEISFKIEYPEFNIDYSFVIKTVDFRNKSYFKARKILQDKGLEISRVLSHKVAMHPFFKEHSFREHWGKICVQIETGTEALLETLKHRNILRLPHKYKFN